MRPLTVPADKVAELLKEVRFDDKGLVLALACDHATGEVLMAAWMNAESLGMTLTSGQMTYWSRSRKELWTKGLTSGNTQTVLGVEIDCDGDALRFRVLQTGHAACHTNRRSCFYRSLQDGRWVIVDEPVRAH